ncbi:uncharacterized protein [Miscanthus floridulus]
MHKEHVEYNGKLRFSQRTYRAICLEYLQGGSLDRYLTACYNGSCDRDWRTLFNIIKGVCEGLYFLHEGCGTPILHLDLKPANILLDDNMVAKIADFGLSRLFHGASTHVTQRESVTGTTKYMAPEYQYRKMISPKNDVFSLGVTMIEVMAGPTGYDEFCQMGDVKQFIDQVNMDWTKQINATASPCASTESDQVDICITIAMKCVDGERNNRPTVAEIVRILKDTEKRFLEESINHTQFLMDQSLSSDIIKSGLVGGKAGTARDVEEKPWRLESLTISYLGLIDEFSFSYIDKAGKQQTVGPWGAGYSHPQEKTETILFEPSEFVEEVSGFYGIHFGNILMMSLTFVTNIRTCGPFGNPYHQNVPSTPFSFRAAEGSSIVGFHGRSGQHLYSIGVYMTQCPSNIKIRRPLPMPGQILPTPTKTGPWGGSAGIARDINEKPWRLESLTISYLGLIDAFSFSYTDQAGKKHSIGPWGEGYHHDKIETIRFDISEFVEEVSGAYGSHSGNVLVTSLTFVTNIRTYGPFGNAHHQNVPATPFRFKADKDSRIVGFHGRSGKHLYSIGVYTV